MKKRGSLEEVIPIDAEIKKFIGSGMWNDNQTLLNIRMYGGFEIFGSYEDWAEGYEITCPGYPEIKAAARYLDDAFKLFIERVNQFGKNK